MSEKDEGAQSFSYQRDYSFNHFQERKKQIKPSQCVPKSNELSNQVMFLNPNKQLPLREKERFIKSKEKENISGLRRIVLKTKAQALSNNFLNKLKLNSINRTPIEDPQILKGFDEKQITCFNSFQDTLRQKKGIKIGNKLLAIWSFLNYLHIIFMVTIFSIMLGFSEVEKSEELKNIRISSILLFIVDMVLNFTIERYQDGRLLKNLKQIWEFYLHNDFIVDLISLMVYILDLVLGSNLSIVLIIISGVKLFVNKKQLEKFEYMYVDTRQKEQYYGLIKVILTNFAIGHILSILLNLMALLSHGNNWWLKLNISQADWFIKYIWGYYWGTNIMLTVGFGDISANNPYEAISLVFIQTFSCITLAYNISYVGALLNQFRQRDEEKKKRLKFFHKMCKQNHISQKLQSKITNLIKQSFEIKQTFCYDEYDKVLASFQKGVQIQYQKEANKTVFDGLGFLSNLTEKSLFKLAQVIERKICYPDQLIYRKGSKAKFVILQKGSLGHACKLKQKGLPLNGKVIDKLEVHQNEKAKILTLDFLKNKSLNFDIKSLGYSILYSLNLEKFRDSLRSSDMDYQLYCVLKDQEDFGLNSDHLHPCDFCQRKNHSKFQCSRIHYVPLKQMVIFRHLHSEKISKNKKQLYLRRKISPLNPLRYNQVIRSDQILLLEEYFDQSESIEAYINQKSTIDMRELSLSFGQLAEKFPKLERKTIFEESNENNQVFKWGLECDQVKNFNHYFKKYNASKYESEGKLRFKKSFFAKLSTITQKLT